MNTRQRNPYTIQTAASMAGVSSRTLRFYDEIDLLKPAWRDPDNGYRYYGRPELLRLQQILFYRELGVELAEIGSILDDPNFDTIQSLRNHRARLREQARNARALIHTIDKTLAQLTGEGAMHERELFRGFDPGVQECHEKELVDRLGEGARQKIEESKRRTANWRREDYAQVQQDFDRVHQGLAELLSAGKPPNDLDVQELVAEHYGVVDRFWTPDAAAYAGLGVMYCEHPEFRRLYDGFHPELAPYLARAMRVFADGLPENDR